MSDIPSTLAQGVCVRAWSSMVVKRFEDDLHAEGFSQYLTDTEDEVKAAEDQIWSN